MQLQPQMTRPIVADEEWQRLLQLGQDLNDQSRSAILDSVGLKEQDLANLREAPQPEGLLTPLLPYQRQGLGWMIQAEHPKEPTEEAESQFWLVRTVQSDLAPNGLPTEQSVEHKVYLNTATNSVAQGKPRLARAGLIADDMGLGKTIQVLALILSSPTGTPFLPAAESCGVSDHFCNTTLIVCPLSVVSNWESQIRQHVETSRLKYYVFHGPQRKRDHKYLSSFDLVITTYETLATVPDDKCPLHKVRWRRVVLDEGHSIRTRGTKKSIAACSLFAERKWVLSGTPLQNKLEDLYPLLKFMEFYPFDNLDIWKGTFDAPIRKGNPRALEKFKALMQTICLRRTKRMKLNGKPLLELPPFRSIVHKIGFNPAERDLYAKWEAKTRVTLEEVLKSAEERAYARQMGYRYAPGAGNAQANGCLLKYLTRLRQLCNHRALAEKDKAPKGGGVARVLALLRENAGEDCPMCLNAMRNPSITMCGHWFCFACLEPAVKASRECPQCQSQMTGEQIYKLPAEGEEDEEDDSGSQAGGGDDDQDHADDKNKDEDEDVSPADGSDTAHASKADAMLGMRFSTADYLSSTKIDALMTFLETSRSRDPTVKSVVFSQWTSMLNLIQIPLRRRGFEFTRLDGSMHRKVREANINRFQTDPNVMVFLISTTAGAVGLNLVAASNCFIVDPMWNPMVERQAIDRIYRIGQKRTVTVVKLAMEDSVEERVLALQERKRRMAEEAFGENPQYQESTSKSARLEDIRAILGNKRKDDAKLAGEIEESDDEGEGDD
ncbi:SNF2 family N-terminal domain-domain-containing protein [Catenaria anguillulae PL171]|uniref:SNF2 family N-terminal domain-domain-containing protein n=1 Tax=Catenaria anguillulae PL171 TaxID=765915 RepID=A0A1Y2HYC5_9FUNG|nr:SNF2 family N-terminal domain-domain-containing protein [Catenaria anguillulae PL171]